MMFFDSVIRFLEHSIALLLHSFIPLMIPLFIFGKIQCNPLHMKITEDSETTCQTLECTRMANVFKQNMNSKIDPCDDFYEFACGGYSERAIKIGIGSFEEVQKLTLDQLQSTIMGVSQSDIRPLQLAKEFYKTCSTDETAKLIGVKPIRDKVLQLGKWPITDTDEGISSWIDIISKSRNLGFFPDYLISLSILTNPRNNSELLLAVIPPSFALPTIILQRGPYENLHVRKYLEVMMLIGIEFQALSPDCSSDSSVRDKLKEVEKVLDFELRLAKITPTILDSSENLLLLEPITLKKMSTQYPTINWPKLLQALVGSAIEIDDAERIVVLSPEFIVGLGSLLEETPESFADIIGPKFVEKYFHEDSKKDVLDMVGRIKRQLKASLTKSAWIDHVTREHALEKLEAIVAVVGYSDEMMNREKDLIHTYENLSLQSGSYYESFLNLFKFTYDQEIAFLRHTKQRKLAVSISPASINAFYIPSENSIVIPAAILQSLFYSIYRPKYLNYGTVGFITGHELSHAFDNYGSHFDKYGNYKNWWQPETESKYKEKIKCFVEQYSNYRINEIEEPIDGFLTLGENIADNEGIKTAYRAYKSWSSEHGVEKKLPGLNYTPEQLFWMSTANVWCAKYTSTYLNFAINADDHAPAMIRVNGQLANQKEFSEDFACPVGSKMNPPGKCLFW